MRRRTVVFIFVLVVAGVVGCGSPEPPVGALTVAPQTIDLAHSAYDRIELTWRMLSEPAGLEGELRVMIHLLDRSGEILRTFDHPFPGGWQVGEERRYEVEIFQSALGPGLEPGEYGLSAGLYDAAGHRWPVEAAGTTSAGDLRVATVAAVEPPAGFPELYFSVAWMPIEEGADLQILGRRWATGDAVIRVGGITGPGAVWLRIGVPDGAEPGQQLVLAAGAAQARSSISAECSGFEAELAGAGSHTLEIPVTVGGDPPGECEIRISANFELISIENQEKRTVVLENLAWSASR